MLRPSVPESFRLIRLRFLIGSLSYQNVTRPLEVHRYLLERCKFLARDDISSAEDAVFLEGNEGACSKCWICGTVDFTVPNCLLNFSLKHWYRLEQLNTFVILRKPDIPDRLMILFYFNILMHFFLITVLENYSSS